MKEFIDENIEAAKKEEKDPNPEPPSPVEPKGSDKSFLWFLLILVIIGVLIFGGNWISQKFSPGPKTIDDLHLETLQGETSDTQFVYNGYSFVKNLDLWFFQWQKGNNLYDVSLRFSPKEVEHLTIEGNGTLDTSDLFITFDPDKEVQKYTAVGATELALNLHRALGVNATAACTSPNPECFGRQILTCENTSKSIIFLNGGEGPARITLDDNCLTFYGEEFELLKGIDRVLYKWYGVIE